MWFLHNQFIKFTLYVLNKLIYPLDTLWIDKDGIHSGKWHGPQIIPASKKRWGRGPAGLWCFMAGRVEGLRPQRFDIRKRNRWR